MLERVRDDRRAEREVERRRAREPLAGLTGEAWLLVKVLEAMGGGGEVVAARGAFAAVAGDDAFDGAFAELAARPVSSTSGRASPRTAARRPAGWSRVDVDVDLPDDAV